GRFIYAESTCTKALQGKTFPVGASAEITLPKYIGYAGGTTAAGVTLKKRSELSKKLRIKSLELTDKKMPKQKLIYKAEVVNRFLAQFQVATETKVGKKWIENVPRHFEFPVLVSEATGKIVKCMIGSSLADACEAIGSELDNTTGKCKPVNQCFFKGHYTFNKCAGGSSCPANIPNQVTGAESCPSASKKTAVGPYTWSYPEDCGKKCTNTITVETTVYLCLRCD
ncbi:MAG: hypothetical protein IT287_05935, partial [Bdellovibrionaceae bacterium]|nr:hypothetical protein [Pseudobdellovibrionaceae bacterium]